ncbi:hypothetical protein [Actinoplanes campanulatus]|uniref:hypothetical protein n=1 Tax=Actinoplanes campanulatus TaxID=113559 RepID=UPI001952C94F|nr:hypothetical protein [Actinoplanes capillaceus]
MTDEVAQLVVRVAQQLCEVTPGEPTDREVRLAVVAAARLIHAEVGAQLDEAVVGAARTGAGYTEIGAAMGMTRQGAQRRWPDVAAVIRATRRVELSADS